MSKLDKKLTKIAFSMDAREQTIRLLKAIRRCTKSMADCQEVIDSLAEAMEKCSASNE